MSEYAWGLTVLRVWNCTCANPKIQFLATKETHKAWLHHTHTDAKSVSYSTYSSFLLICHMNMKSGI